MEHHISRVAGVRVLSMKGRRGLGPVPAVWLTAAVALLVIAAVLATLPAGTTAATSGPRYPGTAASVDGPGYAAWTDPGYIAADDTSYATSYVPQYSGQDSSEDLQGTNYGFSIPLDATINGISVTIGRYSGYYWGTVLNDQDLYLIKAGAKVGTDHASGSGWPTSIGTANYGSTSDLWGTTWTPAQINASDFGVSLSVYNPGSWSGLTAHVDYIRVTVTYTVAALTISTSSPLPGGTVGTAYSQTLTASGGTPSYTWSVDSGSLPAGLTLNGSTGAITGTPTTAGGPTSISFRVTDSTAATATKALSITISKVTPVITWADPADIAYGTALGGTQLCATASVAGTFVYSPAAGTVLSAGSGQTLHVDFTPSDTANYNAASADASIDVNPRALTITANDRGKNYGDTVTFAGTEFTSSGLINSDTVNSVTLTSAGADPGASIGTYPIVPSSASGSGLSNYNITYANGTMTVSALALTITADNDSKTYGSAISFAGSEFTTSGLLAGDSVDSVTLTSAGAGAAGAVGTWSIGPSAAVGTGLAKYTITYVNGTLTVNPKSLTITANDRAKTQGETVTFAGTEFTAAGLVNSDTAASVTLTSSGAGASAPNGDYPIIPSAATGTGLANYNISYVNGTLTVSTYGLTVTANSTSKVYGDTITFAGTEFTTSGLLPGDSVDSVTLTSSGAGATAAAGFYTIIPSAATGTGLAKYTIIYANGILIVGSRPMTITADDATKTYGDALTFAGTEYTAAGLVNSDTVGSVSLTSAGTVAAAAAGTWNIVPGAATGTGLSNYSITYVNGTLTVGLRALTVSTDNATKVYGDTLAFTGTEFTVMGLVNSDNVTGVILASLGANASASAGGYAITGTAVGTGLDNYAIAYVEGILTVTPRDLTITADSRTKSCGQSLTFAGTEFTVAGLAGSDAVASVTLSSSGADLSAPVGNYPIVPSAAVGTGLSNYNITYVNGSLMVRKGIIVTANNLSKTYGDAFTFAGTEFTVTGLEGSDTVTSVTLACAGGDAAAAAGPYDIVISAAVGTGLDNYDVSYVNGMLTVNPRPLCITAGNSSKSSGSTATLTGTEFTTSGLINDDRVAVVTLTSTGADASAAGGTYDIVPSAAIGQGLSNYTITYVNGTLTVDRTTVVWSVTSSPAQTTEGETVTLTATIKPTIVWSVTPPSVSNLPEGEDPLSYDIKLTPSGAVGTLTFNYAGVMMTATVTYIKATGTVIFRDGGTVLGTARLVNGTATFTTSELSAGSHYITATYDGDGNFEGATTLAHVHAVQPGPGPNWWLIGGICGGAVLLGLFLLLLFLLLRRRRQRKQVVVAQG